MIDNTSFEHDDIELLLPWYEKGTLAPDEMRRVEAYLAAHPEIRSQLGLIAEEATETILANEQIGMPSTAARNRLMDAIASETPIRSSRGASALSWWQRLVPENWSPAMAITGAAASVVIVLQAVALVGLLTGGETAPHGTRLASGEQTAPQTGTFVLIRFSDNATAADIASLLQSMQASITDGPKPGGVFRVRVSPKELGAEERQSILKRLREMTDIVRFVAIAG